MPPLPNARAEKFAQELAKGKTLDDAYRLAGYSPARQNAHRLMTKDDVQMRVLELQQKSAEITGLTVATITENLMRIAQKAEALQEAAGLAVARAAQMDAAKLNGLVIDRSENVNRNHAVSGDLPTQDEWERSHVTEH